MSSTVLLTAAKEDTEQVIEDLSELNAGILHYPLEHYKPVSVDVVSETFDQLDTFENIVHGSRRNARFFVDKVQQLDKLEKVRNLLNLALDQSTADFLEDQGIAAVHPESGGKAINLLEFMLRIRRIGNTLYPCGDKTSEELPGFLQELDIPVYEMILFTLEGPPEEELNCYRKEIGSQEPSIVIFHSRRSVTRTLTAFPELNYSDKKIISADRGVTGKLNKEDLKVTAQAEGSWSSILEKVEENL